MDDQPEATDIIFVEVSQYTFSVEDFNGIVELIHCLNSPEGETILARLGIPSNKAFIAKFDDPELEDDTNYEVRRHDHGHFISEICYDDFAQMEDGEVEIIDMPRYAGTE